MLVESQRFGTVEIADDAALSFAAGIIGFPNERRFALLPHQGSPHLAWLQSLTNPELAFPVVSAHVFSDRYPDVPLDDAARAAGIGGPSEQLAALVVLSAPTAQPATVNLLAPIIVNAETRAGAQVILDGTRFTTRELFVIAKAAEPAATDDNPGATANPAAQ